MPEGGGLWRVFPWDPDAPAGQRFSPSYTPPPGGRGRFDLPRELSNVLYLAASPEHAVAEVIQPWRGGRIGEHHLRRAGLPLGLVRVTLARASVANLCDPKLLVETGVSPDRTASRRREVTQLIARRAWDDGYAGLRWWSSFWGDRHTSVLFTARTEAALSFGEPEILATTHPALTSAAEMLGIEVEGSGP